MARPSSLPAGNTGHAFWGNLTHAWTFHATGNTGGADADDIPGTNDATLSGAVLSDTLGLDCDPETDRATITQLDLAPTGDPLSIMCRVKLDADNTEAMVCGDTDAGDYFLWINNSGAVQLRVGGINVSWAGTSGKTTLTDYCVTGDGGANTTWKLYTKAASGSDWTDHGNGSATTSDVSFLIDSLGAGFNSNNLWLQGELEYFFLFNTALTEANLDGEFADPYAILASSSGTSLTPDAVALTLTAPSISRAFAVLPSAVQLSLTPPSITVDQGVQLTPDPVGLALTAPTIARAFQLLPDPVGMTFTAPGITRAFDVRPDPVILTLTAGQISRAFQVLPDATALTIAVPTVATGSQLLPDAVQVTLTAGDVVRAFQVLPDATVVALTIPSPTLTLPQELSPDPVSLALGIPSITISQILAAIVTQRFRLIGTDARNLQLVGTDTTATRLVGTDQRPFVLVGE